MSTSSQFAGQMRRTVRTEDLITLALGVLLVAGLFWIPRSSMISSQPWKLELFSSIFLVGLTICLLSRSKHLSKNLSSLPRWTLIIVGLLLAFAVWSALSAVWATYPLLSVHHTLAWGIYLALLMIFLDLLRSGPGVRIITGAFALTALVAGIVCLIDYLTIIDFASAEGPLRLRYAKMGEMMVTVLPILAVVPFYVRSTRSKMIAYTAAALSWIVVMLSLSKGAFLAGVFGFIILFVGAAVFSTRRIRKKVFLLATVWLLMTVGFQLLFSAALSVPSTTDYISGAADKTRGTSTMRLFTWSVARQMSLNHLSLGVGADNFGIAFNPARADSSDKHTAGTGTEIAEDYMVERAHNEFLQILDELGIVGITLIVGAFGYFAFVLFGLFRRKGWRLSPMLWAAIAGMGAFFASSMVSSFSVRAIENGIALFLVFSIALYEIGKADRGGGERSSSIGWLSLRTVLVFSSIVALLMLVYSGSKAVGEYYLYKAERTSRFEQAEEYNRASIRFDPGNPNAYYLLATKYATEMDYARAAKLLREGMDRGIGVSITYSMLAKYQTQSGDPAAAEKTLTEAVKIFPRSVFLRARFAVFLEDAGRPIETSAQMETARNIDPRQANGWYQMIRNGSLSAYYAAKSDPNIAAPAELWPDGAVRLYLDTPPGSE